MSYEEFKDTSWLSQTGVSEDMVASANLRMMTFRVLYSHLEKHKYTQAELMEKLGESQPRVSDLLNKKINKFSADKLFQYLTTLSNKKYVLVEDSRSGADRRQAI